VAMIAGISLLVSTLSSSFCLGRLLLLVVYSREDLLLVVATGCARVVHRTLLPFPPRRRWQLREPFALMTVFDTKGLPC